MTIDTDVLLRERGETVRVRVQPGWAVQARDALTPSIAEFYESGDEIPNFDAGQAVALLVLGAVEVLS